MWNLGDEPLGEKEFMAKVKSFKAKVAKPLIAEIMNQFLIPKGKQVDVVSMRNKYLTIFPSSEPPPPPKVKGKKDKKGKQKSKQEEKPSPIVPGGTTVDKDKIIQKELYGEPVKAKIIEKDGESEFEEEDEMEEESEEDELEDDDYLEEYEFGEESEESENEEDDDELTESNADEKITTEPN